MHGDSLCTQDKFYQFYRKVVRSTLFKSLFLSLPKSYRQQIAAKMRKRSEEKNQFKSQELMDVVQTTLVNTMDKYHCTQLIYGHTHRPAILFLQPENQSPKAIYVLSDWHAKGNYLLCQPEQPPLLSYF